MAITLAYGQQLHGTASIAALYEAKKYDAAANSLEADITELYKSRNADTLNNYIIWTGRLEAKKSTPEKAVRKVQLLVEKIKTLSTNPVTLSQAFIESGSFYEIISKHEMGYTANQQGLLYALSATDDLRITRLANIENNMGTFAQRMGDISLSISHERKALQWMQQLRTPDYEKLYSIYNSMGNAMYYTSKMDSGIYYFDKALAALAKAPPTLYNKYFRTAMIQNNMAGIYGVLGKTTAGIRAMKTTIANLKQFVADKTPHPKKEMATEFQFEATDNLAGIYKELGDYKQAHDLLYYSWQQKQQQLPAGNDGVLKSEILLGQLYFAMHEYDKALSFLNNGLAKIAVADGDYLFWQADACNTLAQLYETKNSTAAAARYYEKADSLYEASLEGEYDNIYLEFLTNAAGFYAGTGQEKPAFAKANKGYQYIEKTQGAKTLLASGGLLNLAEVSYKLGHYQQAQKYAVQSMAVVNDLAAGSANMLDSVKAELKKPAIILVKAKASYALLAQKNTTTLTPILKELEAALDVLERRKSVIGDAENTGILLADHDDLLEFIQQITAELYAITNNPQYMNRLVELHESGLYHRIRSRLNERDSLKFRSVPATVLAEEKRLQTAINTAIAAEGEHDQIIKNYLQATAAWNQYQEKIRQQYPAYYDMRYATIFRSLDAVQRSIPTEATVVRYFYIGKKLYVWIADGTQKKLLPLNGERITSLMSTFAAAHNDITKTSDVLLQLYNTLWQPFAGNIRSKKIIIIPDGILYNLSFETLTQQKIKNFGELATKSLLAQYAISYQYSLFLLAPEKAVTSFDDGFIAFVPGFSDQLKKGYVNMLSDKTEADRNYLSLLPQPFTIKLANKIQQLLGGDVYANERSTASLFKKLAGNHQVIHIGTHAESDNLHPEFSRLVFAKDTAADDDANYIYLPDIYGCDLRSGLAVLTACESGKPGFKDGEGMISLAHAFNYAGSRSMLTGLWKIDEQVSTIIMDEFYKNIAAGMDKDEALRQAKLHYLATNNGRITDPYYWSGLVIMGDTSPLIITKKHSAWKWWLAGGLVLLAAGYVIRKRIINV